ncbi:MAG: two-component system nitrate/nitrite response regulator NarL [Ulvibacter sp.]|jgi:two-component system nitrate/nitrite response regulator NarL
MIEKINVSIVIADDHPVLLKGLMEELIANGYNVVGNAINGIEALERVLSFKPTIALLDIDMPFLNGFEVVKTAKKKGSITKFIMFSYHREAEFVLQAKSLQIDGYLLKEDSFLEIERCMDMVINGNKFISSAFNSNMLKDVSDDILKLNWLTTSEMTILKLIAQQETTVQIAETLSVSIRTIDKHRSNIKQKLWPKKSSNSLIFWAISNKSLILNCK